MKPLILAIFLCAGLQGPAAASGGLPDPSSQNNAADGDLILDEGPDAVLPAQTEKSQKADNRMDTVKQESGTNAVLEIPAAKKTSDSTAKPGPRPEAVKTAAVPAKDTAKKIVDEELILDGGDEDLLSQPKKPAVKASAVNPGAAPAAADSAAGSNPLADSAGMAVEQPLMKRLKPSQPQAPSGDTPAPKVAAKIETVRSINFAANLKEYRSPKLAMLLSLCVPGAGQIYAKSNWYAAGFLLVEAAIVGTGLVYSSKSRTQKAKAHKFADTAYSADKFQTYTENLHESLNSSLGARGDTIYESIFFDSSDVQFLNEAKKAPGNRNDNFYSDIASETSPYLRGWKDVTPDFETNGFSAMDTSIYHMYSTSADSSYLVYRYNSIGNASFGFSDYQRHYIGILDESRRLANNSRTAFVTLLINHLASAVMAGIEAKKHNDALLGQQSFWRHIDISQQFVCTGSETVTGYSVGVRF